MRGGSLAADERNRVARVRTTLRFLATLCGLLGLEGCDDPATRPPEPTVVVNDPYRDGGQWYKANFHLHSTHSHGRIPAAELVELYRQHGYTAICITDHNQYGDQDGGRLAAFQSDSLVHDWNGDGDLHPDHVYGSGVESYVRDWSAEPPEFCQDRWFRPAGATIQEVPLVISGYEASEGYFGAHFGLVGFPPGAIDPPQPGFEWLARLSAAGGFAYFAHPGDANAIATRFAAGVPIHQFHGIEILNGLRLTRGEVADATPLWDSLLSRGHDLWGLANDDAHEFPGAVDQFPFTAFDLVLCSEPTEAAFLEAMHRGAIVASTGLWFEELRLDGLVLHVRVAGAQHVRFIGGEGRLLSEQTGERATYTIRGDEGYVRVEVRGDLVHAPRNTWARSAWSQPFRITSTTR
jgi:hypothetical protein